MADLNRYSPALFEPTIVSEQSTFGETVRATVGLRLAPAVDRSLISMRFANQERDPNFDWQENLGDHSMYATSLYTAKNAQHMAALKSMIDRSIERRQVLSDSTMLTQLGAGLLDPVNLIALPLGGPSLGVVRSAARVGLGTAAAEGVVEGINYALDPVKTIEEATINTASAALFGAALGGAISIPLSRRAAALEQTNVANAELFQMAARIENLQGMTPDQIRNAPARSLRPLGSVEDAQLRSDIRSYDAEAEKLGADSAGASDLRDQARALRNELGLRQVEDLDVDLNDPFNLKSSWFTNSILYKSVSTPMKRTLQGNYPNAVKETFLRAFGDNGVNVAMNSLGLPTPQSVFVRSAVSSGRWVKAQDDLVKLWAVDTGASATSRLDINLSDMARRVSRSNETYRQWLTNVSEKRLLGVEDLSENELKASSVITKYFGDSEVRLQETGLLNDAKGMQRQIEMLEAEIQGLKSSLKGAARAERSMVEGRIGILTGRKKGLEKMRFEPDTPASKEPFFPRFFDKRAIKKRREEFEKILYNWFEANPYVYRMDKDGPKRVELSTSPEKIRERVNQTIDGILGEADPLSVDTVSFGMGRSKHFRGRQLDIPNRLVTDFMMKDPLAVMKTYAARIEPRYEFAKMFGKDLDGVRFDIKREMLREGKSEAEINKVMRDFEHMYDRTIGTVLENPDALNQKVARFVREAASFSYMGSSGLAAIPDFGRIVMEYEMENVWKGVQAIVDRNRINMTVDEIRLAGEAIDILKGTAHMRLMEDMSNNIDANDLLTQTRNAFYILNGLAPLTTLAKQLAGVIDAHQIIDYSIKLGKGQLDDQGIEWLAKHGIGKDMAEKIARAPYDRTENGLFMANTEAWADSIYIPEIDNKQVRVIYENEDGTPVGKMIGDRYVPASYNHKAKTIRFDRDYIEGEMFEAKPWLDPRTEGIKALPDIFETPRQWSNFVMLHEINHNRFRPEDLGIKKIGLDRDKLVKYINGENVDLDASNLVFHVTTKADEVIKSGFAKGGATFNQPIRELGYGDFITVFDISNLDMQGRKKIDIEVDAGWLLQGQKPVSVINAAEAPNYYGSRQLGARAAEHDMEIETNALTQLEAAYLRGEDITKLPEFDEIRVLGYTEEDAPELIRDFSEKFSDLKKYSKYGSGEKFDMAAYENAINDLALKDYRSAQRLNEETVTQFRAALNSGVLNTIMSGTPADKPIITDGVVYIPMNVASKFGMKEHPKFKGYARIENGLMGLPFQFYSFVFANVNKTVGAMAQGQIKNRAIGSATMMGLAYMSLQLRTPDYVWNEMSAQDRFARSFDMSGIMALYSDIFYTSMHTSLALGGPNITGGLLSPKFKQQASVAEAITGLAGAGPSWAYDTGSAMVNFASGNYGEGGKDIVRNLPFARMWFLKDDVNQITNAWAN